MEASPLISIGLPISLFIIMVGMGMTLTIGDFRNVAVNPRGALVGTLAQIVLMPALAFALIWALSLPPAMAVGLVIIAACPGGTTSNLFAFLARGNVALSIVLTVLASLITIVSLPLLTNFALERFMGEGAQIQLPVLKTIGTLVAIILLPVAIGMTVRSRAPELARRAESAVSVFGGIVLAALIVGLMLGSGDQIPELLRQGGPAAIALNLLGIGAGLLLGRAAGLSHHDAITISVELGVKNATLGLLVTLTLLESSAMSVPSAVYGIFMFFFGFALAAYGRRRFAAEMPAANA